MRDNAWGLIRQHSLRGEWTDKPILTCRTVSDAASAEQLGVWSCSPLRRDHPAPPRKPEAGWTLLSGFQARVCGWWLSEAGVAGGSCWCGRSWDRCHRLQSLGGRRGQGWGGRSGSLRTADDSCETAGERTSRHQGRLLISQLLDKLSIRFRSYSENLLALFWLFPSFGVWKSTKKLFP